MKIFLVMYKSHERDGYHPIVAFKDRLQAELFKSGAMVAASQGYLPYIVQDIELKD